MQHYFKSSFLRLMFVLLLFAGAARAQKQSGLLERASEQSQAAAMANLSPETLVNANQSEFEKLAVTPVLNDLLDKPMKTFTFTVARWAWTFYTSNYWQITAKGLLVLCATIGIGYSLWQLSNSESNASTTVQTLVFKFGVVFVVWLSLAPNFPFVMSRLINSMTQHMGGISSEIIAQLHQRAFLNRSIQAEVYLGRALEHRLANQFYSDPGLLTLHGRPAPISMTPLAKVPGTWEMKPSVTWGSFLHIDPPALIPANLQEKDIPATETQPKQSFRYLVSPPIGSTLSAPTILFNPLTSNPIILSNGGRPSVQYADPFVDGGNEKSAPLQPFGHAIDHALGLYGTLYSKWPELVQKKTHYATLAKVDSIATSIFQGAYNQTIEDILKNYTFIHTPKTYVTYAASLMGPTTVASHQLTPEEVKKLQADLSEQYKLLSETLSQDLKNLSQGESHDWTATHIIPIGLFFANIYIILSIWLMPILLTIWSSFFLLPPIFDVSSALKKGAAAIIVLVLYPPLLQLLIGFCHSLSAAGQNLENTLDPNRAFTGFIAYSLMPDVSSGSEAIGKMTTLFAKVGGATELASMIKESKVGVITFIVWMIIIAILIGSPIIVAKLISGIGGAEALTNPMQSTVVSGATMGARGALYGGARAAGDVSSAVKGSLSNIPR